MSAYTEAGYTSRRDYIEQLADEHGLPFATVATLASLLGASEDFDGLVSACEDAADELARAELRQGATE